MPDSATMEPPVAAATTPQTSQTIPPSPPSSPHMDDARRMLDKREPKAAPTTPPTTPTTPPPGKVDPLLAAAKGTKTAPAAPVEPENPLKAFETPPEGLSEKGKLGWKDFHAKSAEILRQSREAEAKAQKAAEEAAQFKRQYEETVGKYADYDKIKPAHDKMAERLDILDFENSPKFDEQFKRPAREAAAAMQSALDASGQKIDVVAMLAMTPQERRKVANEVVEKLSPIERTEFTEGLFRLERLERDRVAAVSEREKIRQDWRAKEIQQTQQVRQLDEAVLKSVYDTEVAERYPEAQPDEKASDDEKAWAGKYNEARQRLMQDARDLAFKAPSSPEEAARMAVGYADARFRANVVLPAVVAKFEATEKALAEATAKLEAIEKARPGYTPATAQDGATDFSSMSHEQAARAMLGRGRGR